MQLQSTMLITTANPGAKSMEKSIQRTKPERPFKNLEEFRASNLDSVGFVTPNTWPCLDCRGKGCEACGGTGYGTKAAVQQAYKAIIDAWKIEVEAYKLLTTRYKAALAKLTKEDIALLREML
jgi:hypothetical protein